MMITKLKNKHDEIKYFKQLMITEKIYVPHDIPYINEIISVIVYPKILSIKILDSIKGFSYEGNYYWGKTAVLQLELNQKILYSASAPEQSLHIFENCFYQNISIVVPAKIEGTSIEALCKFNHLVPKTIIEHVSTKIFNDKYIFKSISLLVYFEFIPTYELCYSIYNNDSSDFCISYNDYSNKRKISHHKHCIISRPKWSPSGRYLAYLSNYTGSYQLYIAHVCNKKNPNLICERKFNSISSFCFAPDSKNLIVSGITSINKRKELFVINMNTKEIKQITDGMGIIKSFKPKCSSNDNKTYFLREGNSTRNIWSLDLSNNNIKIITSCGLIKDFNISQNCKMLTYITSMELSSDCLYIQIIEDCEDYEVLQCKKITNLCSPKFSNNSKFLAFIGTLCGVDNLYLYNIEHNKLINITKYNVQTKIHDYCWSIDDSKIYYSMSDFDCSIINMINIDTLYMTELLSTIATKIELDYRPKIR